MSKMLRTYGILTQNYHFRRCNMRTIHVTNDELYEFVKLYDILRDMDFELTENQTNVFDKILSMESN